jgi:hypothetical protein
VDRYDRSGSSAGTDTTDVGRLFAAAVIVDLIYESMVYRWIYPGQVLIVAATLALPAYFLIRGLANRLARWWFSSDRQEHPSARSH